MDAALTNEAFDQLLEQVLEFLTFHDYSDTVKVTPEQTVSPVDEYCEAAMRSLLVALAWRAGIITMCRHARPHNVTHTRQYIQLCDTEQCRSCTGNMNANVWDRCLTIQKMYS